MDIKVAVIIPTFNRKACLKECLEAVSSQSLVPSRIFVVDNHSSDGTPDFLHSLGYDSSVNSVPVDYRYLDINGGGAMGFSLGMEKAYISGDYDAFWMLDDDGLPSEKCLEYLCKYINEYNYVSPIVMNCDYRDQLVSPFCGSLDRKVLKEHYHSDCLLKGYCNPFNGGLFSRKLVSFVGFPKKELFIYGDEMNYHQRCIDNGFIPYGVYSAIHYHPGITSKGWQNFKCVRFRPVEWNMYCICRNIAYNNKIRFRIAPLRTVRIAIGHVLYHTYFFLFVNMSLKWLCFFYEAYFCGLFEIWGGQYKYIKK